MSTQLITTTVAVHAHPAMAVAVQQGVGRMFAAGRAAAGELREDIDG